MNNCVCTEATDPPNKPATTLPMQPTRIIITSMVIFAAPSLIDAQDKDVFFGSTYIHPRTERFTDFTFISPLPAPFVNAYSKRKEMGDQYLDFFGVIAIVGETKKQRADMRRLTHALMGLIDNDQDGLPDDEHLWNKWKEKVNDENRLVLYVTEQKAKYKSFDGESPAYIIKGGALSEMVKDCISVIFRRNCFISFRDISGKWNTRKHSALIEIRAALLIMRL